VAGTDVPEGFEPLAEAGGFVDAIDGVHVADCSIRSGEREVVRARAVFAILD
jgi:hypothetical protein